ncbi:MAG: mevalonate kinase [Elusimicrobia bacterium]|nr:mevalonate kinase [Elusimicrobiota bacterium]
MNPPAVSQAKAPSKLILLGEHAVVYGHPSVAVPLDGPSSRASARLGRPGEPIGVELSDFKLAWMRGEAPSADEAKPFAALVERLVSSGLAPDNGWTLTVTSEVPIGCGLGSGASTAAAAFRAVYGLFGVPRGDSELSDDVFAVEKINHGTPSGVDNTVVSHGRPVLFRKGKELAFLAGPGTALHLAVADSGVRHKTSEVVSDVASRRREATERFDAVFSAIGALAEQGRAAFERGDARALGGLMSENHRLLASLGVSSPELETLVLKACVSGALGAKLCGAGRGGCVAALAADAAGALRLAEALKAAGAVTAFAARVGQPRLAGKGRP